MLEISYHHPPLPQFHSLSIAHNPTAHAREALFNEIVVLVHEATEAFKLAERTAYKISRLFNQAGVAYQLQYGKKYFKNQQRHSCSESSKALQQQNVI